MQLEKHLLARVFRIALHSRKQADLKLQTWAMKIWIRALEETKRSEMKDKEAVEIADKARSSLVQKPDVLAEKTHLVQADTTLMHKYELKNRQNSLKGAVKIIALFIKKELKQANTPPTLTSLFIVWKDASSTKKAGASHQTQGTQEKMIPTAL